MMTPAPLHPRESARAQSVGHHLDALDSPDHVFAALVRVAAQQLDFPIAAIGLVHDDLQVFQSTVGFDVAERPREEALCSWVVAHERLVEVPDLLDDPRFRDGSVAALGVRCYIGAPVYDTEGLPIGALCVMDGRPRTLTDAQRRLLEELAESASAQFELLRLRATGRSRGTALTEARRQLLHDPVTGLANSELLDDRLTQALAETGRSSGHVGVCMIDLDQFKRVNDSRGHGTGDRLLRAVADRLTTLIRAGDTVSRFHGDRYVVVWRDLVDPAEVSALDERLDAAFSTPFDVDGTAVTLTASRGVAVGCSPRTPDDLLLEAEAAMETAKSRGCSRTQVFTPELRGARVDRLRTEAELHRALEQDELTLHYQPVLDLAAGQIVGVEALVRWQHPTDGLLPPDSFIPVAESSGLIVPLGAWVIQQACRQAMAWERLGRRLDMAVNLSVRQVTHPDLVPTLRQALDSSGLPADRLLVEVTESAVMEDVEAADVALRAIDALGASVAIDDFGTGYSSLLYLKRYPIRALKVDRSFISGLTEDGDDAAIVASLISLSRAVGGVCIAEGIETHEQHQRLIAMGCHYAQGYLFSRPVAADDLLGAVDDCEKRLAAAGPRRLPGRSSRRATAPLSGAAAGRIRQLHAEGASLHTIAAALNSEGVPHPEGIRWHATFVARHIAVEPRGIRMA